MWEGCVDASYSFLMGRSIGAGGGGLALRGGSQSQDEPKDSKRIDALEREIRELKVMGVSCPSPFIIVMSRSSPISGGCSWSHSLIGPHSLIGLIFFNVCD